VTLEELHEAIARAHEDRTYAANSREFFEANARLHRLERELTNTRRADDRPVMEARKVVR
jgi:hypothetical protein